MNLFDQVLSAAGQLQPGQGNASITEMVTQVINNQQIGGLPGLIQSFENGGQGQIVKSWVSTGQNLPITAEQIHDVLGSELMQNIAGKLGIDTGHLSQQLAEYLPRVVDQLTPNGTVPEGNDLMTEGMALLKGKFFS